jgi:hypothetical protein
VTHCVERLLKIAPRNRIESAKRLVEKNYSRLGSDAARESHALALAARELVRKAIPKIRCGQSHELERIPGCTGWIGHLSKRRYERDVAQHTPMREKPTVLLYVSDFSAQQYCGLGANVPIVDPYLSTHGLHESVEAAKKRRLARPALADERNRAAGRNVDAHVIERDYGPEAM